MLRSNDGGINLMLYLILIGIVSLKIMNFINFGNTCRRLRWTGHIARMEEGRNTYEVL